MTNADAFFIDRRKMIITKLLINNHHIWDIKLYKITKNKLNHAINKML